jgi:hypothetical protein
MPPQSTLKRRARSGRERRPAFCWAKLQYSLASQLVRVGKLRVKYSPSSKIVCVVEMGGDDRAAGSPLQLVQQIADLVGAGHRRIELQPVGVEIAEIAVGQDPDELGLRQKLQGDRIAGRGFPAPRRKPGDEAPSIPCRRAG